MSEFKVGDKVLVQSLLNFHVPFNSRATVTKVDETDTEAPYQVLLDWDPRPKWARVVVAADYHPQESDSKLTPEFSRFAQTLMLEAGHSHEQAYTAALYLQERSE